MALDFTACRRPGQAAVVINVAGPENTRIRTQDGECAIRFLAVEPSREDALAYARDVVRKKPQDLDVIPTCVPFLVARDSPHVKVYENGKVTREYFDPEIHKRHQSKISAIIAENAKRQEQKRRETLLNAELKRMGTVYGRDTVAFLAEAEKKEALGQESKEEETIVSSSSEANAGGAQAYGANAGGAEAGGAQAGGAQAGGAQAGGAQAGGAQAGGIVAPPASASADRVRSKGTLPQFTVDLRNSLHTLMATVIIPDWLMLDELARRVTAWKTARDTEYKRRLDEAFVQAGNDAQTSSDDLREYVKSNPPPWVNRWRAILYEEYKAASAWFTAFDRRRNSSLPVEFRIPRLPRTDDIREIKASLADSTDPRLVALGAETTEDLKTWYLRYRWLEVENRSMELCPRDPAALQRWYEDHERKRALQPRAGWEPAPVPPMDHLLSGSFAWASEARAERQAWVGWLDDNPEPDPMRYPGSAAVLADDTDAQAWLAHLDLKREELRWHAQRMNVPERRDLMRDWYEANPPPLRKDLPAEERVVVPLFAVDTLEEGQKWFEEQGKKLGCLRDVEVAFVTIGKMGRPIDIDHEAIERKWRDARQNKIMGEQQMQATKVKALHEERLLQAMPIKVKEIYDNDTREIMVLPKGMSREEWTRVQAERRELERASLETEEAEERQRESARAKIREAGEAKGLVGAALDAYVEDKYNDLVSDYSRKADRAARDWRVAGSVPAARAAETETRTRESVMFEDLSWLSK